MFSPNYEEFKMKLMFRVRSVLFRQHLSWLSSTLLRRQRHAWAALFAVIASSAIFAQQPEESAKPTAGEKSPKAASRREQRLEAMQKIASAITVKVVEGGEQRKVEMVDGARFRFASQVTPCYDATVWIWGRGGRAAALLTLSAERRGPQNPSYWAYELTSLSPQELAVSSKDGWTWTPQAAGLSFTAVPDAPPPGDSERTRLRQMKDIALRFDANGVGGSGRYDLRVLPTPIHRYSDAAAGIVDGALFFIAGGTDPEVLLVVEASAPDEGPPQWTYAINRVSSAELHARLDGNEIWSSRYVARATIRSPYYLFPRPMLSELGDEEGGK